MRAELMRQLDPSLLARVQRRAAQRQRPAAPAPPDRSAPAAPAAGAAGGSPSAGAGAKGTALPEAVLAGLRAGGGLENLPPPTEADAEKLAWTKRTDEGAAGAAAPSQPEVRRPALAARAVAGGRAGLSALRGGAGRASRLTLCASDSRHAPPALSLYEAGARLKSL